MPGKISKVLSRTGLGPMSTGEYQANHNGLNMFFGAVRGFVLAGSERLDSWQFGVLLTSLAGVVAAQTKPGALTRSPALLLPASTQ